MSNFAFLPREFSTVAESATLAEGHIVGDPRAACFHARFALEAAVHWLYRFDQTLRMPYDRNLGALLHEPTFQNLLPEAVFQKARVIQKMGNQAVHEPRPVRESDARQVVKELHHLCYWLTRTYTPQASRDGAAWRDERVPAPMSKLAAADVVPRAELEGLEKRLAEQNKAALKQQQERDTLDAEVQTLRQKVAEAREAAEQRPDTHDYSEAETRDYLIDVELRRAGWPLDKPEDREYEVTGMPNAKNVGYVDYVLWGENGKPLAVVEAKRTTADAAVGQQQAKLYADCLEEMHGQRPLIFYTNGYETWLWDDEFYPPRQVAGFYTRDELSRVILRRQQRKTPDATVINSDIAGRYYQKRAITSIFSQFEQARRKALLVMATGTGKTRTAVALVDALQRTGWVKRALFLADRVSLVNQAANAFKTHLPDASPVNLVTEKHTEGRVYVCTYPTMMGLIDDMDGDKARFGPGHFDLIIIDEAHRSVYQKYGAIFRYFDSLLVGLTATPREQVDKNTYDLFELEPGVPTDAYELTQAVKDGFLVPPRVQQVDLKFPSQGIDYEQLNDEEKAEWESLDWGDDAEEEGIPSKVNAPAINSWLFNSDTIDKMLQHLMENGYYVDGGDRLAKTIIFARNHEHAKAIEERFNHHYPKYAGQFARIIDNKAKFPQSLIDDFSQPEKAPHIAISVDMLDTGIDVPEVANLVFFKPVYSKIKFWQMVGRGTRLCPGLFGPGGEEDEKKNFRVFDFCFNFDFFKENPEGIEASGGVPLGTRLFRSRVQLLSHLQTTSDLDSGKQLTPKLADALQAEVSTMNPDNFIVRMHLASVETFKERDSWNQLDNESRQTLINDVAGLPTEQEPEQIESRLFDLTALRMQLAHIEGDTATFEQLRRRVVEMASLLEEKSSVPLVKAQLGYLQALADIGFWEGINVNMLEEMRLRLRELTPFLDKKRRPIVYTDFKDEVLGVRDEEVFELPKMTGVQYARKVEAYLKEHLDNIVIRRLRTNQPLTQTDLESLETMLTTIGEEDGEELLQNLMAQHEAPSLAHFIRGLVGMDNEAAKAAFSQYLSDHSLTVPQMRFIEMVIEQLTARGVMDASALYEAPFSSVHAGGPDALFADRNNVIEGIFEALEATQPRIVTKAG
ncbi:DEAD/DEAH box helicase family protein [Kushneria sp. TE3]|uniref:DEAD/DEAH box helicase family protein n=1 Tax=Kushneria sp. TE3 TaxID=3449832 RepID=UPI003F685657